MTYVEFYDRVSLENIATCLSYMPDRVILIGSGPPVDARIRQYKWLLKKRSGRDVLIESKTLNKTNLSEAVKQLDRLLNSICDDIVFDITGGDEVLVLALGMVHAAHPEKKMQIHKMNLHTGRMYDCDRDGETVFENVPQLSIEENVRIYGGMVLEGDIDSKQTYDWKLTEDFRADLNKMWNLCRAKERLWNVQISILETICADTKPSDLTVTAKSDKVRFELRDKRIDYKKKKDDGFIASLLRLGLLTQFEEQDEAITVSFKNPQVKRCLTTEGQVLELKMYVIAKDAAHNGVPVYNDALNGVKIDWDGVVHSEAEKVDVDNEIDVMLMHGVVPLFISCKNGNLKTEELYKLHTVARRFGGPYSRMVLVAPYLDQLDDGSRLRARAGELGIIVLDGDTILKASDAALTELLGSLWYS